MRKFVILFLFLILFTPTLIEADTIVFKNGKRLKADQTWKEEGQIKYSRFGAIIGYPLNLIDHIEIDEKSETKSITTPDEISYQDKSEEIQAKPLKAARTNEDIREFSERKYPNDYKMQQYIYKTQISAEGYMRGVTDSEVKKIAIYKYPHDYSMQQFIYDKQLSAKHYMRTVSNYNAKLRAHKRYPHDYSMQKFIYDKIVNKLHYYVIKGEKGNENLPKMWLPEK